MTAPSSRTGATDREVEAGQHAPCCSSHGVTMSCARYRRTHFVEVRPCCAADRAALLAEQPGDGR